jgi:putative DNA methylase
MDRGGTVTTYKKKLIEVAIPLEAINASSAREKSIRHGHPSTLHLWWARRPLAACRAVLFAQLVDDPSSHPDQFPTHEDQERERQRLFAIIEDLVKWENSTNEEVLERARAEIRRSCGGVLPPVYDPFSGGGSIPLEAQRLGLPAYGSDLNPVAVMIGKAMIEIPPKFKDMPPIHPGIKERSFYRNAEGLAEDVKYYGEWMREKAWERIGHLYPQVDLPKEYGGGKATVIAWIWARTVPSPDPAFADVQVPLASTFLLSAKKGQEAWVEPLVDKNAKSITYRIRLKGTKSEIDHAKSGTAAGKRQGFICPFSGAPISYDYIRKAGQNGEMKAVMLSIIAEGPRGRIFLDPDQAHGEIANSAVPDWRPETKLHGKTRVNVSNYGLDTYGDLFLDRQLVALNAFGDLVKEARLLALRDAEAAFKTDDGTRLREGGVGAVAYADALAVYLAFVVSSQADRMSTICTWDAGGPTWGTKTRNTFSRQAIPMSWDFTETNPFSTQSGSFGNSLDYTSKGVISNAANKGIVTQIDARHIDPGRQCVISTDPPYYDNIGYADLSDFFYVWLKRICGEVYPDIFGVIATPKADELIAAPYRHGGKDEAEAYFLHGMTQAISRMVALSPDGFPATIYYAFKQSEIADEGISSTGWATFLQAVIEAGFAVVGTWPMRTELANRLIASGTNALANSVVLVCRKKEASAEVITRAEFIRALKRELPPAIAELQAANIAPADMPQSAIGPGMGVFSRYKAVLESDDSPMTVKAALQLINRELDEYLGGIQGEFDADTRFAITWFEQNGLKAGDYGTANNIATARGISVESVKHAGIVESAAGKVRILKRDEMDAEWEPDADGHLTVWECCQHLVRLHEKYGIGYEAAVMLKKFGPKADDVRDLAYVLYNICEKRGDAKEATAYNALIADWTDLTREAATAPLTNRSGQMRFEV